MEANALELYFDDPRLRMTVAGRALVRFCFYVGYFVLIPAAFLLLLPGPAVHTFWLGLLLALFLLDRVLHIGKAEEQISFLPRNGRVNLARTLSPKGFAALETALDKSRLGRGDFRLYLVERLVERTEVEAVLTRMEVQKKNLILHADREFSVNPLADPEAILALVAKLVFAAFRVAVEERAKEVQPIDLFTALASVGDQRLEKVLALAAITRSELETAALASRVAYKNPLSIFRSREAGGAYPYRLRHRVMNRAWTARPTPFLDKISDDITDLARSGLAGFLVGHEEEYNRLLDVLSRPGNPSAILLAEPGTGKEAIISHLAYAIIKDLVPQPLYDKRLVSLSISSLVSGTTSRGELESRVQRIVKEIVAAGNVILYIPDAHNLVKTEGEQGLSVSDVFIPAIKEGFFPVIAAASTREYKHYIEPKSDLVAALEVIRVQEISDSDAMKILTYMTVTYEREYRVTITLGAVKQAVLIAHKYFRAKPLPGSAIDLLKEGLAEVVRRKDKALTGDIIVSVAERKVNVPLHEAGESEASELLNMEARIHADLAGQEEAVTAVSRELREYRSGLSRKGGPIASFLFVGPTGVGKTKLSKILAQIQFGSEKFMVRFDMSEYQDKQSFFRFIGSPDGTVTGALTDAVLERPYTLILLDEFEKAHPDILNLFLQVFDDGRLTDNLGRTVDFTNTIIIATSNAHSDFIKQSLEAGKTVAQISEELKHSLIDFFKPELLNRFTQIIVFKTLGRDDTKKIAALQLKQFEEDLVTAQNITFKYGDDVVQKIAELGFSITFGARPLRNVISEKLRGPIAELILARKIVRNDAIEAKIENGEFAFYNIHGRIE